MKSIKEKLTAECGSAQLERIDNWFKVKYFGCETKLARNVKDVEKAMVNLTDKAFTKQKRKHLSANYFLHLTDTQVSLYPSGKASRLFVLPIEKLSYSFHWEKKYYIMSLVKHVSQQEVDLFVVCCTKTKTMARINSAFYYVFKDRQFAMNRAERQRAKSELAMAVSERQQKLEKDQQQKAKNLDKFPNKPNGNATLGYEYCSVDEGKNMYINRQTEVVEIHRSSSLTEPGKSITQYPASVVDAMSSIDINKEQFSRSARRYPRSSWC